MSKPLVIYHWPCTDGWTAAWAIAKAHGGPEHVDLHPANYGDDPPNVEGRDVVIVDFSYPRDTLLAMYDVADSLLVLDHHKSAMEALSGLAFATFDMNRSGAGMAWDLFLPGIKRPALVNYVEDRDIWRKALPHTEEITAAISTYECTFANWETLYETMEGMEIRDLMAEGSAILRYQRQLVRQSMERAGLVTLMGRTEIVPCVVCEPTLRSDVGHQLLHAPVRIPEKGVGGGTVPYSVTFRESVDGFTYSLRSEDDRMDVAKIAEGLKERFGIVTSGGGHRNAAGVHATAPIHIWVDGL